MAILDFLFGSGGSEDAGKAMEALQSVPLPVLKEYYPELYKQVVSLNPQMEEAVNLGPSEMAGIATDPSLRQAQLKALSKLQEVGDAKGMDSQFLADSARVMGDVDSQVRGREGAIQQNLATRGMSGGMSEIVQRNLAAQEGANRNAQSGLDLKAQAEQRALQAIMQSGQLGGQMQAQDFSQAAQKAQAADAIAKFNAQNTQGVNTRNTGYTNDAQKYNAGVSQDVSNKNVGVKNDATQYNLNLPQQQFENQIKKATGISNQYGDQAARKDKERDEDRRFIGGLVQAGAGYYGGMK